MFALNDKSEEQPWYVVCYRLVQRGVQTYERAPFVFFLMALLFSIPALAYTVIEATLIDPPLNQWVSLPITAILYTGAFVLTTAGGVAAASASRDGNRPTLGLCLGAVFSKAGPLAVTVVVSGLLEAIGFLAVYIPGLLLMIWVAFAGPVTMREGVSGWGAVQRGRALVSNYRWMQVGAMLLMAAAAHFLVGMMPVFGLNMYLLVSHTKTLFTEWLLVGWTSMVDLFMTSFIAAWVGTAYFDLTDSPP